MMCYEISKFQHCGWDIELETDVRDIVFLRSNMFIMLHRAASSKASTIARCSEIIETYVFIYSLIATGHYVRVENNIMPPFNGVINANDAINSSSSNCSDIYSSSNSENNYGHRNIFSSAEIKKKYFNNRGQEVPKLLKGVDPNKDQSYFLSMTQVND